MKRGIFSFLMLFNVLLHDMNYNEKEREREREGSPLSLQRHFPSLNANGNCMSILSPRNLFFLLLHLLLVAIECFLT